MDIVGILVKQVGMREGVSSRNGQAWRMAEFLVEIPGNYPRRIKFDVKDGQVGRIDRFKSMIGKTVKVSFDLDAHEFEGKWYNEINAWGIMEYVVGQQQPAAAPLAAAPEALPPHLAQGAEQKKDDLPF